MKLSLLKKQLLGNTPSNIDLSEDIARLIIEARIAKGLTQTELAKRTGTKQPSIARIENGASLPTLRFLERIALALSTTLIPPRFSFLETERRTLSISSRGSSVINEAIAIVAETERNIPNTSLRLFFKKRAENTQSFKIASL
ncbi:MAG: helix-turn-helix domain-containing protein [Candidatus Andersenbacteria bacterium]|nr:helix-turn-helix domain-containing protein [Candidatus Andersenbacteria bacterium]